MNTEDDKYRDKLAQMDKDIFMFDPSKIRIIELPDGKEIWTYEGDVVRLRR